jgi:sensor domain CHASE-containing protein
MTFRRKLLVVFALTVFMSVAGVALLVQWVTRNAFERTENQRTAALVAQFQREFNRRGDDVARRVEAIAASDSVTRMATALNGTSSDFAEYFDLARLMAESHQLDFLEIIDRRGTIVSSAQWPAKFGYPEPTFESLSTSSDQGPFLKLEELQDSTALGFFAARAIHGASVPFTL